MYLNIQVNKVKDGLLTRDYISMDQVLAQSIGMQVYQPTYVVSVEPEVN